MNVGELVEALARAPKNAAVVFFDAYCDDTEFSINLVTFKANSNAVILYEDRQEGGPDETVLFRKEES